MGHRRESRAQSLNSGPGRGWTLQFSGLETLEKARQHIQYHPSGDFGKGVNRNNQAGRGKVLTAKQLTSNGCSGPGFNYLLNQSLGQGFRLGWVTGCGRGKHHPSLQQFPRRRSGEKYLDPRGASPGEQGSRPRVSMAVETRVKPDNAFSIRSGQDQRKGLERLPPESLASIRHQSCRNQTTIRQKRKTPGCIASRPAAGAARGRASLASPGTSAAPGQPCHRVRSATQRPAAGLNHSTLRYNSRCHHQQCRASRPRPVARARSPAPPRRRLRNPQPPLARAAHTGAHPGHPATRGQGQPRPGRRRPSCTHPSPGVQNVLFSYGRCTALSVSTGAAMYLSNRGDVSADRNQG